jgi:HlyD family secretion protein
LQTSAQAQLAQIQAGAREEDIAAAEAQYQQALAQYRSLKNNPAQEEIEIARATLGQTEAQLKQAQAAYDQVAWRPEVSMLPQSLALEQATLAYQQAQAQYDLAVKGADDETLAAAWQRVEQADAQLARLKNGPTPEEIAVAEAAVRQAESGVARAELALARTTLTAPFAGTVTRITVEEGDALAPGQTVARLATLDQIQVRTIDLTELDAVRVDVGQPVTVTIDALPDVALRGYVEEIALEAVDYRGDVTYPVTVALEETAPELRLGMTAVVKIAAD